MAFESVRKSLAKLFGFGGKPKTVIPTSRSAQYVSQFGGDPEKEIIFAIKNKQPVSFFYNDKWQEEGTPGKYGQRVGNPHAIWYGDNGTVYVHLYVDPQSASATGDLPGWRTFILKRIQNVSVLQLGTKLFGRPIEFVTGPGYNRSWYGQNGIAIALVQ